MFHGYLEATIQKLQLIALAPEGVDNLGQVVGKETRLYQMFDVTSLDRP